MLIAKKPCYFDRQYLIGEEIPEVVVDDPKRQERLGVIAIANSEGSGASGAVPGALYTKEQLDKIVADKIAEYEATKPVGELSGDSLTEIPLQTESGVLEAKMSISSVVAAITIMQKTADEAAEEIKAVEDDDVLKILNAADSRKSVKSAAMKRHEEIQQSETGGDADGEEL